MVFLYIQKTIGGILRKPGSVYKYVQYKWKNKNWIYSTSPKHDRESITCSALKGEETDTKITIIQVEIDVSEEK